MSRRRLSAIALGVAALTVAACTPPGLSAPIVASTSASVSLLPNSPTALVIGLDGTPTGFNPHAIADFTTAARAVAALVLPNASVVAADGGRRLDSDLLDSAQVTSSDPFTVTYHLNRRASWSDGTPITGEDFGYLRDAMSTASGTVDPAGYRLITAIRSIDAGKTVQVQFAQPVADWLSLFSPLLPAHIMKDSPGGWATALSSGLPVSGNRYKMIDLDTTTGEITLARNDKFWGSQPGPATVLLRVGAADALVEALDRGDLQAAVLDPSGTGAARVAATVPDTRRTPVTDPGTVQLVFDVRTGATADRAVRRAIGLALDAGRLRADLADGRPDAVTAVSSQVRMPGRPTEPVPIRTADPSAATAALVQLGYRRTGVYLTKDGAPLRVVLGYSGPDKRLALAAADVQAQLGVVGVEVDLQPFASTASVVARDTGTSSTGVAADMTLLFVPRADSDAVAAASAFGCPSTPVTSGPAPTRTAGPAAVVVVRSGNLSGYCDSQVDAALATALRGTDGGAALAQVDARLWADLPVYPIGTLTRIFAVAPRLAPVVAMAGPGWTYSGALAGLSGWPTG